MKPRAPAWLPPDYTARDVEAFKALAAGKADADQQATALRWITEKAAGTYEQAFRSDQDGGERETSFALGRTFVGQQVVKLINMPPEILGKLRKSE